MYLLNFFLRFGLFIGLPFCGFFVVPFESFGSFVLFCFLIYFWLRWVFVAVRRLSLVAVSGGYSLLWCTFSHCGGFSCCGAQALGAQASVVVARRLSSCGARA